MNWIFAIALLIISYTIQALTAKKPAGVEDAKPATFSDFTFPQHEEGTPQPVIFGDVWIEDEMILYYGRLSSQAIRTQSSGGKKG
jgi:hypothetical protein